MIKMNVAYDMIKIFWKITCFNGITRWSTRLKDDLVVWLKEHNISYKKALSQAKASYTKKSK